jgi:hypothetical protein
LPKAKEVLDAEFKLISADTSLVAFNDEFLAKNKDSARHVFAAVRVRNLLPESDAKKNEEDVISTLGFPNVKFEEVSEGLEVLKGLKSTKVEEYRQKATQRWSKATVFAAAK